MDNTYSFKEVTKHDFTLLHTWLNQDFIVANWNGEQSFENVEKKYRKKIESKKEFPFIAYLNKEPIAYIQTYNAYQYDEDWWSDQPKGTWGIDLFIAKKELLGKGHGPKILQAFMKKITTDFPVKKFIIDPKPSNSRAIRAYEKAGFEAVRIIRTPDGKSLLMEKYID